MSQYPIRGKLYVGSITAVEGTSGTLIGSPDGDLFTLEFPELAKTLYNAEGNVNDVAIMGQEAHLVLNLRDMSSTALNLLFQNLRASGIGTMGSGSVRLSAKTAVIIRPKKATAGVYFYSPGMAKAKEGQARRLMFGRQELHTDGNELRLVSTVVGLNEPPSWYGTAAEIAAKYAGLTES